MTPGADGRRFLAFKVALGLVTVLLGAELAARVATGLQWRATVRAFDEVAHRYEGSRGFIPRITVGQVTGDVGGFPAPLFYEDGRIEVVPFSEVPESAFAQPPRFDTARPDVVRIAFLGGSTTFEGYPQLTERILADEFGEDRIEVVNMGIPAGTSATSLLTAERFFDAYDPQIVVVYHGFNDLVFYRTRAAATVRLRRGDAGLDSPAFLAGGGSRGLWTLLSGDHGLPELGELEASVIDEPISNYAALDRLCRDGGRDLFVSTFAAPSYPDLSPRDRAYFDVSIQVLWPILETTEWYAARLAEYNRALTRFAEQSGPTLIDVAAAVRGGRETFTDNCHRTSRGMQAHAEAAADSLRPAVARWLERGPGSAGESAGGQATGP